MDSQTELLKHILWLHAIHCAAKICGPLSRQCEIPWWFTAVLPMLSVTRIMPVLELLSMVGVGMQQCMIWNQNEICKLGKVKTFFKNKQLIRFTPSISFITSVYYVNITNVWTNMQLRINSFRPLFPDKIFSLTLPWLLVKSNISRFSIPVVSGHPVWIQIHLHTFANIWL